MELLIEFFELPAPGHLQSFDPYRLPPTGKHNDAKVMAYLRYSRTCEWYIFERDDSRLAVWHKDFRSSDASFDRVEVESMLSADSFLVVPGYRLDQKDILREAFQAWLQDPVA